MSFALSRAEKTRIDLWTSEDMLFSQPKRGFFTIPKFTSCYKPVYNQKIKRYLLDMERKGFGRPSPGVKAVCVHLCGQLRYVWRTDVLTKEQYEELKNEEKSRALGVLGKKSKGALG